MKIIMLALALAILAAAPARAEETKALMLKSQAAIAAVTPHRSAPFVQPIGEPEPEPLFTPRDLRQEQSRSSCESDRALCYDPASGRIVYKPAREYMPEVPGLQRENISLKRDRIVLRYSF